MLSSRPKRKTQQLPHERQRHIRDFIRVRGGTHTRQQQQNIYDINKISIFIQRKLKSIFVCAVMCFVCVCVEGKSTRNKP